MTNAARFEALHPQISLFAGADLFQLTGHEHEPGAVRPLYEDDVWDWRGLSLAPKTMTDREKIWDFRRISNPSWRSMAKDLLLALMVPKHPDIVLIATAHRRIYDPRTIFTRFCGLVRWFNWLSSIGVASLQAVDQDVCDRYLRVVREGRNGLRRKKRRLVSGSLAQWVEAVRLPYCYGDLFPGDAYKKEFSPWGGRRTAAIVGKRNIRINSTPPVPQEILQPLIGNCAYLIETIAPLVLDLHRERLAHFPVKRGARSIAASTSAKQDFEAVVALYVKAHTPLPQLSESLVSRRLAGKWESSDPLLAVNIDALFREADIGSFHWAHLPHIRHSLEDAVADVGVEYAWARDAVLVQKASNDGLVPWTLPLSENDLHRLNHYVCGASMVLTAAITGMRPSEIAELSTRSPRPVVHLPGGGKRFILGSKIIKRRRFGGDPDEWVVLESVHKAVETAAELASLGKDHIFGAANIGSFVDNFRSWLAEPFAVRLGLAHIPPGPVNGRMLRRALSIEIGNRPWGLFAAKYHLKHASVITTEGYVARPGGAQAQFNREVLASESEHRLHLARQAVDDYRAGKVPAGPGARQLIEQLKLADEALRLEEVASPKVVKSDRAAENIIREIAAALHVNVANYCFFRDPKQALCLRLAGKTDAKAPLTAMCDSARCGQASFGPEHLQIWTNYTANTEALAHSVATAPGERIRLRLEVKRGKEVIRQIKDSTRDPQK
ncbi:hypothetical protein [Arthrobacter sp. H-02-3]|uniref:hypothetical protein n=1 Tax=Arthrobacter sp. H-02-3 TaxID=2703675 RepID=UPI00105829BF|nr:hypothetical protein [Arthrobacter sp. H-02-3]